MTRFDVSRVVSSFRRARVSGLSDEAFAEQCIKLTLRYFASPRRPRKAKPGLADKRAT
jgi:hypothetical protein